MAWPWVAIWKNVVVPLAVAAAADPRARPLPAAGLLVEISCSSCSVVSSGSCTGHGSFAATGKGGVCVAVEGEDSVYSTKSTSPLGADARVSSSEEPQLSNGP